MSAILTFILGNRWVALPPLLLAALCGGFWAWGRHTLAQDYRAREAALTAQIRAAQARVVSLAEAPWVIRRLRGIWR